MPALGKQGACGGKEVSTGAGKHFLHVLSGLWQMAKMERRVVYPTGHNDTIQEAAKKSDGVRKTILLNIFPH